MESERILPVTVVDSGLMARYMLERTSALVAVVPVYVVGEGKEDIFSEFASSLTAHFVANDVLRGNGGLERTLELVASF